MATEDIKNKSSQEQQMPDKGRRDALKTLATVPVLGALAYGVYKTRKNALQSRNISDVFQVSNKQAVFLEPQKLRYPWQTIDARGRICRAFMDR